MPTHEYTMNSSVQNQYTIHTEPEQVDKKNSRKNSRNQTMKELRDTHPIAGWAGEVLGFLVVCVPLLAASGCAGWLMAILLASR